MMLKKPCEASARDVQPQHVILASREKSSVVGVTHVKDVQSAVIQRSAMWKSYRKDLVGTRKEKPIVH